LDEKNVSFFKVGILTEASWGDLGETLCDLLDLWYPQLQETGWSPPKLCQLCMEVFVEWRNIQ
jgi:hypothetical protein